MAWPLNNKVMLNLVIKLLDGECRLNSHYIRRDRDDTFILCIVNEYSGDQSGVCG